MKWVNLFKYVFALAVLFPPLAAYVQNPVSLTANHAKAAHMTVNNPDFLKADNSIKDMLNHPALKDFAIHMLPQTRDAARSLAIRDVAALMPWHSHIRVGDVLAGINRLIHDSSHGLPVFYSFYDNPSRKTSSGLFFFRGEEGAPFAVICPGGGFRYVGSLHEGFPIADYISQHGYNAFVLQYRTGGEGLACEDLAMALSWIFKHATELKVDLHAYSLWGGSAGARMAANLGSFGAEYFGGTRMPRPAAVILAYTGHSRLTSQDPPTFSVVSADDPIASAAVMGERTRKLKAFGIDAELLQFMHAGHGFGTGRGTDADGWLNKALIFWEKQIKKQDKFNKP